MFGKVSSEAKKNNNEYTKECRKIYEELNFAEIEKRLIHGASFSIAVAFTVTYLVIVCVISIVCICSVSAGQSKFTDWIPAYIVTLALLFAGIGAFIYHWAVSRGKVKPRYFVRDENIPYEIYCTETEDKRLEISTLINRNSHKALGMANGECVEYNELAEAPETVTGFYQYIVQPTQVFKKSVTERLYFKIKYKKVRGDKIVYYFKNLGLACGKRYARSIVLEKGILKSISVQELSVLQGSGKKRCTSYVYNYSSVNSDERKLYLTKAMQIEAQKRKFRLPRESQNIIYRDE